MSEWAKQSTAKTFLVGPILDANGVAKTDEVVASIKVTKNGTVGAPHASSTLTHDHTGHYKYAANAGDIDTLGEVEISLNSGTNAMAPVKFQVVPARAYDMFVANSVHIPIGDSVGNVTPIDGAFTASKLGNDLRHWSASSFSYGQLSAVTSTSVMRLATGTTAFTADDQPNDKFVLIIWAGQGVGGYAMITDYTVATDEVTLSPALDVLPNTSSYYSVVPIGLARAMGIGGAALATQTSVDAIDDYIDTEVAAIKAKTDNIPSDPADASDIVALFSAIQSHGDSTWTTATGFSTHSAADVVTALGTGSSLTDLATATDLATVAGYLDTEIAAIKAVSDKLNDTLEDDGGTYRFTTNALEQAPSGGGGGSLTSEQWTALGNYIDYFPIATGEVVTDAANTTSYFKTDLTTINYKGMVLKFKSDVASTDNAKQARRILAHNTATGFITVDVAFTELPTDGDTFGMAGYQSSVV